jgi:hypothetical protein
LQFFYILASWGGSAHDGRVLQFARFTTFDIPEGKYYLANAGYGLKKDFFLTPYRGIRSI